MNRDGEAVGEWADMLTDDQIKEGLEDMMRVRAFDARMLMAQRQGKTSFYMQALGEEAIACAFRKALEPGDMNSRPIASRDFFCRRTIPWST